MKHKLTLENQGTYSQDNTKRWDILLNKKPTRLYIVKSYCDQLGGNAFYLMVHNPKKFEDHQELFIGWKKKKVLARAQLLLDGAFNV